MVSPGPDPLEQVCASHALRLVQRLPVLDGGAEFLARVKDPEGEGLFLKRGSGLRGSGEFRMLQAYSATGHVPGLLKTLDAETFVMAWVEGLPLDQSQRDATELLRECGMALARLHAAPMPPGLMPIRERASRAWVVRDLSVRLPPEMVAAGSAAASALTVYEESSAVPLHGDVVPGNIIDAGERVVFIDPIGFSGPSGWDVAQLAVAFSGQDRRQNLDDLVAGYGTTPANLEPAFRYLALMFLGKNLELEEAKPGTRRRFVSELTALASSLV